MNSLLAQLPMQNVSIENKQKIHADPIFAKITFFFCAFSSAQLSITVTKRFLTFVFHKWENETNY